MMMKDATVVCDEMMLYNDDVMDDAVAREREEEEKEEKNKNVA